MMDKVIKVEQFYLRQEWTKVTRVELEGEGESDIWFADWTDLSNKHLITEDTMLNKLRKMYEERASIIQSTLVGIGGGSGVVNNNPTYGGIALYNQVIEKVAEERNSSDLSQLGKAPNTVKGIQQQFLDQLFHDSIYSIFYNRQTISQQDAVELLKNIKSKIESTLIRTDSKPITDLVEKLPDLGNTDIKIGDLVVGKLVRDKGSSEKPRQEAGELTHMDSSISVVKNESFTFILETKTLKKLVPVPMKSQEVKIGDIVSGYPVLRSVHGKERIEGKVIEINGKWGEHINIEREVKPTKGGGKETIVLEGSTVVRLNQR
jgi:hypothetical protein